MVFVRQLLFTFMRLLFNMHFQNFLAVCFHMSPQIACLRGCIITFIAFVQLFSTVRFQMCPQSADIQGRQGTSSQYQNSYLDLAV